MDSYTKRGSAVIDWCETNYQFHPQIAEFFNTISNAIFFVIPPIMIVLFRDFGKYVTNGIHVIWLFLVIVGLGSVYFHATLAMAGQLMDELSILWVLMTSYTILFPDKLLPIYFHKRRNLWYLGFTVITLIVTIFCLLFPIMNAYFLLLFGVPIMTFLYILSKDSPKAVARLAKRTGLMWTISMLCWISDRLMCDFWIKLNFPYLHAIFHVFIFFTAYSSIVLFAFFAAEYRVPHLKPLIAYWPSSKSPEYICIPFIDFNYLKKQNKNQSLIYSHENNTKNKASRKFS